MTITYVKGDLFAANERSLCHGCNCHGVMGAGVARIVRNRFPPAFNEYTRAHRTGQFYPGAAQPVPCDDDGGEVTMVYNLATQNAPGANAKIGFVERAFTNMKAHMDYVGNKRIAMPKIGSGIGGLDWEDVAEVLKDVFHPDGNYDVVVYEL